MLTITIQIQEQDGSTSSQVLHYDHPPTKNLRHWLTNQIQFIIDKLNKGK